MRRKTKRQVYKAVFIVFLSFVPLYILFRKPSRQQSKDTREEIFRGGFVNRTANQSANLLPFRAVTIPLLRPAASVSLGQYSETSFREIEAVVDYCNPPEKPAAGAEGQTPPGFKLRMVHIFTRHGDRTSIHRLPGYKPADVSCKFHKWYTGSNKRFQEFPIHMNRMSGRQNGRGRFLDWALFPDKDNCSGSMLTSRGALQHLKLGEYLQSVYIRTLHLFSSDLSLRSQLIVKSTGTQRTYQSAIAFIYGFLTNFNTSDIVIEYSQSLQFCSRDKHAQKGCMCNNAHNLFSRAKLYIAQITKRNPSLQKSHKMVSEVFNIDNVEILSHVADFLVPFVCHNISRECSSQSFPDCVPYDVIGMVWDTLIAQELSHKEDPELNMLKYSSIVMTPVLMEIVRRMHDLVEGRSSPKFILYSGHDLTLSPLLHALGLHDGRWPSYASRVILELFEFENSEQNRLYVRFLYNGVDKTNDVTCCRGKLFHGLCAFSYFNDFVVSDMLRRYGYLNYYDACSK